MTGLFQELLKLLVCLLFGWAGLPSALVDGEFESVVTPLIETAFDW